MVNGGGGGARADNGTTYDIKSLLELLLLLDGDEEGVVTSTSTQVG